MIFLNAELVLIEKIVFQTKIPDLTVPLKLPMKAKDVALGVEQALIITPEGAIEVLGGPNRGPVEGLHGPICVSYYCYQKYLSRTACFRLRQSNIFLRIAHQNS
jgi:hypothetical protein